MPKVTAVVIGAGQSGLAMSWHLARRSIDHVVFERAEVAQAWRSGKWDSLRLLTPNWFNRLPGYRYEGSDPDGYMTAPEVAGYVAGYGAAIAAPVRTGSEVTGVELDARAGGYLVRAGDDEWRARAVVLASGPYNRPDLPAVAGRVPPDVVSLTPSEYRNPDQLPDGGVLVIGAAATGVQLAHEIQSSGRPVTLSVGGHVRLPRLYRGLDIMWWLDAAGVLAERYDEVDDVVRARHVASFQLVGSPNRITVDLNELQRNGVRIVGRLGGITDEGVAQFSGSLLNQCTLADLKLNRLLESLDEWATAARLELEVERPERFEPTRVPPDSPLLVSLRSGEIKTVLWATGYRSDYPWLNVPVLDAKGLVRHDGGVTAAAGLYLIGGPVLRRRKSSLIDGAGEDAADLAQLLADHLDRVTNVV
jgi:putative flavoprotein involved in K+ transport